MRSRLALFVLLIFIIALFILAVLARLFLPSQALVNGENMGVMQSYELDSTIDDSLVIFAENVELLPESHVTGDAAFVGSDITIAGRIDGDLTVTSEIFVLEETAQIGGDITVVADAVRLNGAIGGDVTFSGDRIVAAPNTALAGTLSVCSGIFTDQRTGQQAEPLSCADFDVAALVEGFRANLLQSGAVETNAAGRLVYALGSTILVAFLLAGLATLAETLFPRQLDTMDSALRRPQSPLFTGVLTALLLVGLGAAAVVLTALVPPLGLFIVPAVLVISLITLMLILVGILPIALLLGSWLMRRFSSAQWPPLIAATLGSLVLVLVIGLPVLVPYGALVSLGLFSLVALLSVGVALNTRLGTRGPHSRLAASTESQYPQTT
jgi:hypothetical protein